MAQHTYIFADNTFTKLFQDCTGHRVDFRALAKVFKTDGDNEAHFFFQKNDTIGWKQYRDMFSMFENFGWIVHNPVEQSISNLSYTPAMEGMALASEVMLTAAQTEHLEGTIRFVLCCNHLSYAPLLQRLQTAYSGVEVVMVTDPQHVNDELAKEIDELVNVYDLGIEYKVTA